MSRVEARRRVAVREAAKWRVPLEGTEYAVIPPGQQMKNPVVVDDQVLVSTFSPGRVYALDRSSGAVRWRFDVGGLGGAPVLTLGDVAVTSSNRTIFALRLRDGSLLWSRTPFDEEGEHIYSFPVAHGSYLFFGDRDGNIRALVAKTGEEAWVRRVAEGDVNSTFHAEAGVVFAATNDATVVALDALDGSLRWRTSIDEPSISQVQRIADGVVIDTNRSVFVLDPADGRVLRRYHSPDELVTDALALAEDLLVVARRLRKKGAAVADDAPMPPGRIRRLSSTEQLWESDYSSVGAHSLTLSAVSAFAIDARIGGLGFIALEDGHRAVEFDLPLGDEGFMVSRPGEDFDTLYVLVEPGVVYALHHPFAAS